MSGATPTNSTGRTQTSPPRLLQQQDPESGLLTSLPPEFVDGMALPGLSVVTREDASLAKNSIQAKSVEAILEVFKDMFIRKGGGLLYETDLEAAAKELNCSARDLMKRAGSELRNAKRLEIDTLGKIKNAEEIGAHFNSVMDVLNEHADILILCRKTQLHSKELPLSDSVRQLFRQVIERGEATSLVLVKSPPTEMVAEIKALTEKKFHGIWSLWEQRNLITDADFPTDLGKYLCSGTVRVGCSGADPDAIKVIQRINQILEREGGFENSHWVRVVRGISNSEKSESLKGALKVCLPVVIATKVLERYFPHGLHAVGGMLDDLFGAILPNVSQNMGEKSQPFFERLKKAWPILRDGLVSLPVAFGLGMTSAWMYAGAEASPGTRMLAGVLFALACSSGTIGTTIGAFRESWRSISRLSKDPEFGEMVSELTWFQKAKLAFKESILSVPFRIGHTLIGVPTQIGLGALAGLMGFFHHSGFVMVEGMIETIFGAIAAFAAPAIATYIRNRKLSEVTVARR